MVFLKKSLFLLFIISFGFAEGTAPRVSAYWNGSYFIEQEAKPSSRNHRHIALFGDTVYLHSHHFPCYGHALLDGLIPFYKILKENDLLETPINIVIETESGYQGNACNNVEQLMRDIFKVKDIIWVHQGKNKLLCKNLIAHQGVPFNQTSSENPNNPFAFYRACPESWKYIHDLRKLGFCDDVVYQGKGIEDNIVLDFVGFVNKKYEIDLPLIKNRILLVHRDHPQSIINEKELVNFLSNQGYDVRLKQFENMSVKEQIIETIQAEYFIGVYGSNLVNAIFLHPEAKVVVIWPKFGKYFWSRRYCVIHSAFLAAGVTLIEYDKPDHALDHYHCTNLESTYFYRQEKKVHLREEKKNMDAILAYPLPASFELRTVDMYVDPAEIAHHLLTK